MCMYSIQGGKSAVYYETTSLSEATQGCLCVLMNNKGHLCTLMLKRMFSLAAYMYMHT